jgi:hypothetical protein
VVGFVTILKKGNKDMLTKLRQEDILITESHPPSSKQYIKVIQEAVDPREEDYKQ